VAQTLTYTADGAGSQVTGGGSEIVMGAGGAMRIVIADRRTQAAHPVALRPALRPIPFHRLDVGAAGDRPVTLFATVVLDEPAGPGVTLALPAAPARLEGVALPPGAFHYASRPGGVAVEDGREVWRPADPAAAPGGLRIELAPASVLVRNAAAARLRPYLYTPNIAATLAVVALAALAVVLLPRRRASPPAPLAPPAPGRI